MHDDIYYLASGEQVIVIDRLVSGKFVIEFLFEDESGCLFKSSCDSIVDKVYKEPPRTAYDTTIKELKDTIKDLQTEKYQIQKEITASTQEYESIMKKYNKFSGLKNLNRFINGEITHYVELHYSGIKIIDFENSRANFGDNELKLLTLFGESGGNLTWKLNEYADGSGGNYKIIPCVSYEDALRVAKEEAQKIVENDIRRDKLSTRDLEYALAYQIVIPEEVLENMFSSQSVRYKKNKQVHENSILKDDQALHDLRASIDKVKNIPEICDEYKD